MKKKLLSFTAILILSLMLVSQVFASGLLVQKMTITTTCNPDCVINIERDYGLYRTMTTEFTEDNVLVCLQVEKGDRLCR